MIFILYTPIFYKSIESDKRSASIVTSGKKRNMNFLLSNIPLCDILLDQLIGHLIQLR